MYDQLRFDYLSCAGHPFLETPNMDRLAAMGVRFSRCYVQSPICGASRMSFYTGRYAHSHGAQWNGFPLKVGELTLGDHMRRIGMDCWLVGRTHMRADAEGMQRLGLEPDSVIGARVAECGFDIFVRDDGLWAHGPDGYYDEGRSPYNAYLNSRGYTGENPWHDYANAGIGNDSNMASGFLLMNAGRKANIDEPDSETPWLTSRAIEFLDGRADGTTKPWLCHLSYIKPHWPYIVPAPYHEMYGGNQVVPVHRSHAELENPHPVYAAFTRNPISKALSRKDVRETVVSAYMGLIKQCDDQLGRLLDHMETSGRMEDTMIVLTSDHGDYLGDHWLGEKNLFHEPSVKVPLIVYDPDRAADSTRGSTCDALVESIDTVATFIAAGGGAVPGHIVEGRSLLPFVRGENPASWRSYAISEYDYSVSPIALRLGVSCRDARLFMVADKRWKFVHAEGGMRPMLFNLETDPDEFADLGDCPRHAEVRDMMYERLGQWARRMSQRTTRSDEQIEAMRGKSERRGIILGPHDASDIEPELISKYVGPPGSGKTRPRPVRGVLASDKGDQ